MTTERMTRSFCLAGAALFAMIAATACTPFEATAPEGFAAYDDVFQFRAVSSDGIMYRVRAEENDPYAELAFWKEALKKRMADAGYTFVAEDEIKAGEQPGYLLELAAPVGQEDYTYLVAIFAQDPDIIIAEASGEVTRFNAHRDVVLKAIRAIR